jgi:hypothetical protein
MVQATILEKFDLSAMQGAPESHTKKQDESGLNQANQPSSKK